MEAPRELTFEAVDQLAIAYAEDSIEQTGFPWRFFPVHIGPLIELSQLVVVGSLPRWIPDTIDFGALGEFAKRLQDRGRSWICENSGRSGFTRLGKVYDDEEDTHWARFSVKAKKAGELAQLPAALAGQLVGALKELHSNVYEHSERSESGIVAFGSHVGVFEFIVADRGIGVLRSLLSNPKYAVLTSDAEALRLSLQPGVSRHVQPLHGHGFDRMFTGLLNLESSLRFRSGRGALTIDGVRDHNPVPIVRERPYIDGFLISVTCRPQARNYKSNT